MVYMTVNGIKRNYTLADALLDPADLLRINGLYDPTIRKIVDRDFSSALRVLDPASFAEQVRDSDLAQLLYNTRIKKLFKLETAIFLKVSELHPEILAQALQCTDLQKFTYMHSHSLSINVKEIFNSIAQLDDPLFAQIMRSTDLSAFQTPKSIYSLLFPLERAIKRRISKLSANDYALASQSTDHAKLLNGQNFNIPIIKRKNRLPKIMQADPELLPTALKNTDLSSLVRSISHATDTERTLSFINNILDLDNGKCYEILQNTDISDLIQRVRMYTLDDQYALLRDETINNILETTAFLTPELYAKAIKSTNREELINAAKELGIDQLAKIHESWDPEDTTKFVEAQQVCMVKQQVVQAAYLPAQEYM